MTETPLETCELLCLDLPKAEALRRSRMDDDALRLAADRAKGLGDPTRLAIAKALRDAHGELCVCDLAWVVEHSDQLVSHHVRVLRNAGLVDSRREGKMVMYSLTADGSGLLDSVLAEVRA